MRIEQQKTLTQKDKQDFSALILASLGEKLLPILGGKKKTLLFLQKSFSPKNCFFIKEKNSIVAFLAFKTKDGSFINPSLANFVDVYGVFGIIKAFVFEIIEHKLKTKEIHIQAIAVDPLFRGKSLGSNLVQHFFEYAKKKSYKIASLEVIDTNKRAFSLYEKLGFIIKKKHSIGFLKMFFPFKFDYALLMNKRLNL